jgi:hypothetical protein
VAKDTMREIACDPARESARDPTREALRRALLEAAVEFCDYAGVKSFKTPIPGTKPPLFIAVGDEAEIRAAARSSESRPRAPLVKTCKLTAPREN